MAGTRSACCATSSRPVHERASGECWSCRAAGPSSCTRSPGRCQAARSSGAGLERWLAERHVPLVALVAWATLDHSDIHATVLREAIGNHAAGSAAANDHVVIRSLCNGRVVVTGIEVRCDCRKTLRGNLRCHGSRMWHDPLYHVEITHCTASPRQRGARPCPRRQPPYRPCPTRGGPQTWGCSSQGCVSQAAPHSCCC